MDREQIKNIKTKDEARAYAQEWQQWVGDQNLSYGELAEWHLDFVELGRKFGLLKEFAENAIV